MYILRDLSLMETNIMLQPTVELTIHAVNVIYRLKEESKWSQSYYAYLCGGNLLCFFLGTLSEDFYVT